MRTKHFLIILAALIIIPMSIKAWGFWAHKRINRIAVFILPPEMFGFYKENIEYLTENAVNPDKRRYATKHEAPRHYIDIDHYGKYPFDNLPRDWKGAVEKYSEDTLNAYGIVPWNIEKYVFKLQKAFESKDARRILSISADLGHYIGDAHVPLHTTKNYNGQLSGQYGIHGFWESRLPELFAEDYDYFIGKAEYIEKPLDYVWKFTLESHLAVDTVLSFEKQLSEEFAKDKQYSFETRGATNVRTYSKEYSDAYHQMMENMVERRMRKAIKAVGDLWFTAWVNAGQPNLDNLEKRELSEEEKKEAEALEKQFKQGKIKGREHQH